MIPVVWWRATATAQHYYNPSLFQKQPFRSPIHIRTLYNQQSKLLATIGIRQNSSRLRNGKVLIHWKKIIWQNLNSKSDSKQT